MLKLILLSFCFEVLLSNNSAGISFTNNTNICHQKHCIRKCCPENHHIKGRNCSYNIDNIIFEPKVFRVEEKSTISVEFYILSANNCAINQRRFKTNKEDLLYVQENGYLLRLNKAKKKTFIPWSQYCLDTIEENNQTRSVALICKNKDEIGKRSDPMTSIICMIISMPFLLATFLVYAILPDRNLHQRALMLYVLTLCISYVLLVTVNLAVFDEPLCPIVGYLTMFFFMVSFFWINVICFDIWYTFSGGRGFVGSKRSSETRRFLLYNIYAWGVPLLHIGVVLLMQHIILPADSKHNPNVGTGKCFLNDGYPNLWYFYGEAGILIIINVILFLRTAFKIRQVKKETSMLKHSDSQRHAYEKDKQRFNLYLKLLFAMGVNWSMEVISWLVNWQTKNKYVEVWYLTDFFNAVYGVFIFFIFVFKKKTWKLLQKRYYNFVGKPHLAQTMTSSNTRTSHYSSTNYSTAETTLTDRTNGAGPEEVRLRQVS